MYIYIYTHTQTHTSSYKCNDNAIMASMMLIYSWLKFTDKALFTACVIFIAVFILFNTAHVKLIYHYYVFVLLSH